MNLNSCVLLTDLIKHKLHSDEKYAFKRNIPLYHIIRHNLPMWPRLPIIIV